MTDYPFLGASPDGLISCDFHRIGVIEIKCPYKYKNGLKEAIDDYNFPSDIQKMETRKSHAYYFQIQLQILATDRK